MFVAVVTIAITVASLFASSVANASTSIVNSTGVLYAAFYAMSALANAWHYRGQIAASRRDAIMVGVFPLLAVAFLTWISVKSIVGFPPGTQWTLAGILGTGCLALLVAKFGYRSPFFSIRHEPELLAAAAE